MAAHSGCTVIWLHHHVTWPRVCFHAPALADAAAVAVVLMMKVTVRLLAAWQHAPGEVLLQCSDLFAVLGACDTAG